MYCTIRVAKTKALISFIFVFVFAYAKSRFSHDAAHMQPHQLVSFSLLRQYNISSFYPQRSNSRVAYFVSDLGRNFEASFSYNHIFIFEPRHEKTGFLHMRKQRRISASR